jgi:hypothetical protein
MLVINGVSVKITAEVPSINIDEIMTNFQPFKDWVANIDKQLTINSIHFQNVDFSSSGKILFVKFRCEAYFGKETRRIPGYLI